MDKPEGKKDLPIYEFPIPALSTRIDEEMEYWEDRIKAALHVPRESLIDDLQSMARTKRQEELLRLYCSLPKGALK